MPDEPPMPTDRAALAQQQAKLVAALTRQASTPEGFDAAHIDRSASALINKRMRIVEKGWPTLAAALGNDFRETFRQFAETHPLKVDDSTDDGKHFAEFLFARNLLPLDAAPLLLAARLRSGSPVQILRTDGRRWIGFRLPLLGTRISASGPLALSQFRL